jgi:hypothetical protein
MKKTLKMLVKAANVRKALVKKAQSKNGNVSVFYSDHSQD